MIELKNLRELFLHDNLIKEVRGLEGLENLYSLSLSNNPIPPKLQDELWSPIDDDFDAEKSVKYCRQRISKEQWKPEWFKLYNKQ